MVTTVADEEGYVDGDDNFDARRVLGAKAEVSRPV